eukprot:s119_g25.t1
MEGQGAALSASETEDQERLVAGDGEHPSTGSVSAALGAPGARELSLAPSVSEATHTPSPRGRIAEQGPTESREGVDVVAPAAIDNPPNSPSPDNVSLKEPKEEQEEEIDPALAGRGAASSAPASPVPAASPDIDQEEAEQEDVELPPATTELGQLKEEAEAEEPAEEPVEGPAEGAAASAPTDRGGAKKAEKRNFYEGQGLVKNWLRNITHYRFAGRDYRFVPQKLDYDFATVDYIEFCLNFQAYRRIANVTDTILLVEYRRISEDYQDWVDRYGFIGEGRQRAYATIERTPSLISYLEPGGEEQLSPVAKAAARPPAPKTPPKAPHVPPPADPPPARDTAEVIRENVVQRQRSAEKHNKASLPEAIKHTTQQDPENPRVTFTLIEGYPKAKIVQVHDTPEDALAACGIVIQQPDLSILGAHQPDEPEPDAEGAAFSAPDSREGAASSASTDPYFLSDLAWQNLHQGDPIAIDPNVEVYTHLPDTEEEGRTVFTEYTEETPEAREERLRQAEEVEAARREAHRIQRAAEALAAFEEKAETARFQHGEDAGEAPDFDVEEYQRQSAAKRPAAFYNKYPKPPPKKQRVVAPSCATKTCSSYRTLHDEYWFQGQRPGSCLVALDWRNTLDKCLLRHFWRLQTDCRNELGTCSRAPLIFGVEFVIVSFSGYNRSLELTSEIYSFCEYERSQGLPFLGYAITRERSGGGGKADYLSGIAANVLVDDDPEILIEVYGAGAHTIQSFCNSAWISELIAYLHQNPEDYILSTFCRKPKNYKGAALNQAHQASQLASDAASAALSSQQEVIQTRSQLQATLHAASAQQQHFGEVAAAMRDGAVQAIGHVQDEARAVIEDRERVFGDYRTNLEQHAMSLVEDARRNAVEEVNVARNTIEGQARLFVQHHQNRLQREMEKELQRQSVQFQQHLDHEVRDRDLRIQQLESALSQYQAEAVGTPIPPSPKDGGPYPTQVVGLDDYVDDHEMEPVVQHVMEATAAEGSPLPVHPTTMPHSFGDYLQVSSPPGLRQDAVVSFDVFTPTASGMPVTQLTDAAQPALGYPCPSGRVSAQPVTQGTTPMVMPAFQQVPFPKAPRLPDLPTEELRDHLRMSLCRPLDPTVLDGIPQTQEGFQALKDMVANLTEVFRQSAIHQNDSSSSTTRAGAPVLVDKFKASIQQSMRSIFEQRNNQEAAVPIAAPASRAPLQTNAEGAASSAPIPAPVFPPGMPPLPLFKLNEGQQVPISFAGGDGGGDSGSSESSSDSEGEGSRRTIPTRNQCRVCGELHDEADCPQLTMNLQSTASSSVRDFAQREEDTIRVKPLNDLTFPNPPDNAAQARGYVNHVLMAIGKLQNSSGNEVYQWAQECLTSTNEALKLGQRFPRLDREIASKLIKTCKSGRFGLIFQQMVEAERSTSGGMPCGRVMLRYIFKYFQLERDRLGMLGERNLLSLKMPGNSVADLENFRDKYIYVMSTIPLDELPREHTLFNHLVDELEHNSTIAPKVMKAREASHGSHRRTTKWLWEKVELAIQLDQQKRNRLDFDKQLKLKPAQGYAGTQGKPDNVPGAPATKDKEKKGKEKKTKEKGKKEKEKAQGAAPSAPTAPASTDSLAFEGSKILDGEEVYVLKECPPAQSIGKTVMDKGYMFVWDPREDVPYLISPKDLNRCRMRVHRNARICASRVVEYVPQYDEELRPISFEPGDRMVPMPAAVPAAKPSEGAASSAPGPPGPRVLQPGDPRDIQPDPDWAPSLPDIEPPNMDDVAEADVPAPPAPAEGASPSAPGKSPDEAKGKLLREEALSEEHMRTHFPKNPYCRICNIAKNTSMRVARRKDGKADDFVDPPKRALEQLATDDVILAKGDGHFGIGVGGIKTHHVIRDLFSGARMAYPLSKRDIPSHAKNFRHFVGLKANEVSTKTYIKMDEAGELEQAAHQVGFTPDTSLPNRWPHNAILERDVREEKECCRSIHLQSGLPYEFHTYSFPYACLSMSFDRPSLSDEDKTQWEAITKEKFSGRRLCFGQLVYFRKKSPSKRTLEPNMSPGLFLGRRVDPGFRYREVVRVLDYLEYRTKSIASPIDVPESELFVEEGPPIFPIAHARDVALREGGNPDSKVAPEIPLRELPFPPEGGMASPSTPSGPKARGVYITVDRILKFKETPGCKGCIGESTKHNEECRARFAKLVEEEKAEARKVATAEGAAPSALEPSAPSVIPVHNPEPVYGLPHNERGVAEFESMIADMEEEPQEVAPSPFTTAIVSGVAITPHTASRTPPINKQGNLPQFGTTVPACMADTSQPRKQPRQNRRSKRAAVKRTKPGTQRLHKPCAKAWKALHKGCAMHRLEMLAT